MNRLPDATDASRWRLDRRGAVALLALPGIWLSPASRPALAAGRAGPCRKEGCGVQEFWIVDTRRAPVCRDLVDGVERIEFSAKSGHRLLQIGRDEFLAAIEPSMPTVFYIHGNSIDAREAITAGEQLIDGIGADAPPYRFIVWSWPADRIAGMGYVDGARVKAARSESQGYYLAWLLDQLDPQTPVGLVGYSLGARTVMAALSGLANGEVAGHPLIELKHVEERTVQATLLAAAEDSTWLWPDRRHGLALTQVERLLVTVNPRDRLLQHFRRLSSDNALGTSGIPEAGRLGILRSKVNEVVVTPWVGTSHRWLRYTRSEAIMSLVRPYLFDW